MSDDYEGDFSTRRALIYTLRFTAKIYLFGPVSSASQDIIKKVSVGYISASSAGADAKSGGRDLQYSVEPTATKNYTGTSITKLSSDIEKTDLYIDVDDASSILPNTYIVINNETIQVKSKTENKLSVTRGANGTTISSHVLGSSVLGVTDQDNNLIEVGDDFGFSGGFLWKWLKNTRN